MSDERLACLYWASVASLTNEEYSAGLPEPEYVRRCSQVTKLEFFMSSLDNPEHLIDFPNLVELSVHLEKVPRLVGLQNKLSLLRLSMTEVGLKRMLGCEACVQLQHLDLSHNKLTEMEPYVLGRLTKLNSLWLHDNAIERMQGLEPLTQLSQLWLGANRIAGICDALASNASLEELNLAGNLISNFKDIPNLARMRRLSSLSFSEPHFGDNPLCSLCNYQTYLLFHMTHLRMFDTQLITDDLRQLAEATYMKKKMYYNMRIKTLKRNTSNVIRKAMEARQTKVSQINLNLNVLLRQAKDVERALHERTLALGDKQAPQGAVADGLDALQRKHTVLLDGVSSKVTEIEAVEARAAALKQTVCETSQTSICRLMVELETGGNIRLEDGKPTDVWYSSCVDLVSSRFLAADFSEYGLGGMRISRVTRIHNRYLRNRFETRLEELVSTADGSYKRSLEYLFFAEPADLPGELARTMEEGFRSDLNSYLGPCGHAAVPLSNSVALSDLPRLAAEAEQLTREEREQLHTGETTGRHVGVLTTQLLITKVFLSKCAQEKTTPQRKGSDVSSPICRDDYSGFASVYRAAGTDPKQRKWYVFEPALVLPEYLVEIEYLPARRPPEREPSAAQLAELGGGLASGGGGVTSDAEAVDLANLTRPLSRFVQQCALASAADPYDEVCTAALNMPPPLPQRTKVEKLTPEVLALQSAEPGGKAAAQPETLNLHGNALRKIEGLGHCTQLRVLVLCFNEIARIEGLETLRNLERLELGFNLIKRIEGLKGLSALKWLELNNNLIYRLDDVSVLVKHVPQIQTLTLRNNAVCEVKSYRMQLLAQLPALTMLDGIAVDGESERTPMPESSAQITPDMIRTHAYSRKRYSYSLRPNSIAKADAAKADASSPAGYVTANGHGKSQNVFGGFKASLAGNVGADVSEDGPSSSGVVQVSDSRPASGLRKATSVEDDWWRTVEELELNHQHLRKLHGLEKLVNLRKASFCNNELSRVEGLDRCVSIEELSLEDNRIIKLENLSTLRRLTKLDVGKNKITHVEGLESLSLLSQLSLEDNDICSLTPLAKVVSLMELYIGNNRLVQLKEVQQLKELPKLIILDLSGNPLCEADDYRSYTVYQLRNLKVLDGVGIEQTELLSAKERFAGRLTTEGLVERLGHSFWHHVRELDLSRAKLRELDALHADGFSNLRELNLDGNMIPDVHHLPRLPALNVLRLNNNVISTAPEGRGASAAAESAGIGLATMSALEVLQLGFNSISDVGSLKLNALSGLKILHLQGNEIQRVDGLSSQQQLRELVLDRNKIKALEPASFAALTNLRELRMEECGLRTLANFGPLPMLQALFLSGNRIAELTEIDRINHLPALTELFLSNTPCSRKPLYRPTTLRKLLVLRVLDGRDVAPDERERADLMLSTDRSAAPYATALLQVSKPVGHRTPCLVPAVRLPTLRASRVAQGGARAASHGQQGAAQADFAELRDDGRARGPGSRNRWRPWSRWHRCRGGLRGSALRRQWDERRCRRRRPTWLEPDECGARILLLAARQAEYDAAC